MTGNATDGGAVTGRMNRTFEIRLIHLTLARAMCVDWSRTETGAPTIDPKRPYGNSSVALDIARLAGVRWPSEDLADYDEQADALTVRCMELHRQMQTVMEILLGNAGAAVEPGVYVNKAPEYYRPKWERV
jgi:hypothetical protein